MALRFWVVFFLLSLGACSSIPPQISQTEIEKASDLIEEESTISLSETSLNIIYRWALDRKLPVGPLRNSIYRFRVEPWRDYPENLYFVENEALRIWELNPNLWDQLRSIISKGGVLTEEKIVSELIVVETIVEFDNCSSLPDAISQIAAAYEAPEPEKLIVYTDGPQYIAAKNELLGDTQIRYEHEAHPVLYAWLELIEDLEDCGFRASWKGEL